MSDKDINFQRKNDGLVRQYVKIFLLQLWLYSKTTNSSLPQVFRRGIFV